MVSSWRKRRNKRRGGNMSFGSAPSSPSFGSSAPSSSGTGFFSNLKQKASAKASELKMKANMMGNDLKNKANNLKFKAQMKGQ